MKCPDCGKELEFIADFSEEEQKDIDFILTKVQMASELTKFENDFSTFKSDEQIFEYIKSVTDQLAEAKYLDITTFLKLKKKYAPDEKAELKFIDGKMYKHPL